MNVYIYKAGLHCERCAGRIKVRLLQAGKRPPIVGDETTFHSDTYPKGPYSQGGGEADSPQHCGSCGLFLENPLTGEGRDYVREAVTEGLKKSGRGVACVTWQAFYGIEGDVES